MCLQSFPFLASPESLVYVIAAANATADAEATIALLALILALSIFALSSWGFENDDQSSWYLESDSIRHSGNATSPTTSLPEPILTHVLMSSDSYSVRPGAYTDGKLLTNAACSHYTMFVSFLWQDHVKSCSCVYRQGEHSPLLPPPTTPLGTNTALGCVDGSDTSTNVTTIEVDVCAICLASLVDGEDVCTSQNVHCCHRFHVNCALKWFLRSPLCPCCRRNYLRSSKNTTAKTSAMADWSQQRLDNGWMGSSMAEVWVAIREVIDRAH